MSLFNLVAADCSQLDCIFILSYSYKSFPKVTFRDPSIHPSGSPIKWFGFFSYVPILYPFLPVVIPQQSNKCDLEGVHSCSVIKLSPCSCNQSHHKWQRVTWRENLLCIHVTFPFMLTWRDVLTFSLLASYREAQQSSLNLTPYIGRNVLCGRLPAFICSAERPWTLLVAIERLYKNRRRQWSRLNVIYSISVPDIELVVSFRRRKSCHLTLTGHWRLI